MVKMLLCLVCGLVVGTAALQMRQRQLELRHKATTLQEQIERKQARLWSQQLQIAMHTAPNALGTTVGKDLGLVPEARLPEKAGNWMAEPRLEDRRTPR
jgi:uncharacterized membrane-anchored protein YhcB (DUF1043 family)